MFHDVTYAGCAIDRAARLRADTVWLGQRLRDPSSRIIPVCSDQNLILQGEQMCAAVLTNESCGYPLPEMTTVALLGVDADGHAYFAVDSTTIGLNAGDYGADAMLTDLRRVSGSLPRADAALLAYARGLVLWHRRHRFCGTCGAETELSQGGHVRICTDPACSTQHFPRTDPAIIVLVTRHSPGEEVCLLARQPGWPRGLISTLAGFVEPGESVEEAVIREVREETAVEIRSLRYLGSQPWPFPSSLMLGYLAEAEEGSEITLDALELEHGRWFTRADVADIRSLGFKLPTRDSIARNLIEQWLQYPEPATGSG